MREFQRRGMWMPLLGCVALAFAVGRCSPISPSVPKSLLRSERSAAIPDLHPGAAPVDMADSTFRVAIRIITAQTLGVTELQKTFTLTQDQIRTLESSGKLEFRMDSLAPSQPVALLRLDSSAEITLEDLSKLELNLSHMTSGVWMMSIKDPAKVLTRATAIDMIGQGGAVSSSLAEPVSPLSTETDVTPAPSATPSVCPSPSTVPISAL